MSLACVLVLHLSACGGQTDPASRVEQDTAFLCSEECQTLDSGARLYAYYRTLDGEHMQSAQLLP